MRVKVLCPVLVGCLCILIASCGRKAGADGSAAQGDPALAELTQLVRRYSFEKHKLPENLDELVTAGYLKAVPPAPAGKKFAVDTKRAEVILVNQ